ncbi:zinc ribbon domain-containing protein [Nocardioides marmoribigeumensis]|uniref:Nucleic acid-binding Zn-ribbon protein n=1 Tax=Nocardioides marmoribigeumensis TaxID=433649 RepID=A0ABU2BR56_9ACTN|nr:C4-type zinc ribbon domain-containing protein [Nocardioides marmoribigeumensis]MDR7360756.1 putative nucleic acid-binding Zn-ribbon protein [Nocardioides marmoribigeumensis]
MKADPFAQLKLLDVQELDSGHDALRHQARNPPEGPELAALKAQRDELDGRAQDLRLAVDDLTREQRKADADVEQVKARRVRDQQRLDGGTITNPKDLEHLQHELLALDKRVSDLEDVELEVMERLEQAQADLDAARAELERVEQRAAELDAARAERLTDLRAQAAKLKEKRAQVVADLPADLLALYDKLREQKDGVGAALLRQRRCSGCSLQLDNRDLGQIKALPSNEVVRCEECGRILVRTGESGL